MWEDCLHFFSPFSYPQVNLLSPVICSWSLSWLPVEPSHYRCIPYLGENSLKIHHVAYSSSLCSPPPEFLCLVWTLMCVFWFLAPPFQAELSFSLSSPEKLEQIADWSRGVLSPFSGWAQCHLIQRGQGWVVESTMPALYNCFQQNFALR